MQKIFQITINHDSLGCSPQGKVIISDEEEFSILFFGKVLRSEQLPLILPLDFFTLGYQARWTDFLYLNGIPGYTNLLVINDLVLNLIGKFNLASNQIWQNLPVRKKEKEIKYNLLYIYENSLPFIDFQKTDFFFTRGNKILEPAPINSLEDYKRLKPKLGVQYMRQPRLKCKFPIFKTNIPYSLFKISGPITGYFVTQDLKKAMEEANITGIKFISAEEIEHLYG